MTVEKPQRIGRAQVMRRLLAHYEQPRYLEVGVCEGRADAVVSGKITLPANRLKRYDHQAAEAKV